MKLKDLLLLLFLCAFITLLYHIHCKKMHPFPFHTTSPLCAHSGSCAPNPCLNNGVCEERRGKFKCRCSKLFRGRRCEKAKHICKKNTCGYGECVLTAVPPFYECKCKAPFKPPNCRTSLPCEPNPCLNGGSCIKDGEDFDCVCKEGFTGKFCQIDPDDCYETNGESYRGMVSETEDGDDCLFWNSYYLLGKGINPFINFEDIHGLGPHNFCRNPDGETKPWCFIRSGKTLRWNPCNVRKCSTVPSFIPPTLQTTTPIKLHVTPRPIHLNPTTQPTPSIHQPGTHIPKSPVPGTPTSESLVPVTHTVGSPMPGSSVPGSQVPHVLRQFETCGEPQPKKPINRIYGGLKALPGAQPWQASIQIRPKVSTLGFKHICGGALIKPCWVMTAGHCIVKGHDFQVVLGGVDLGKVEPSEQTLEVVETIVHEQYRETPESVYNDIALLRLRAKDGRCAKESQFIRTVCLAKESFPDGSECKISGWGVTPESQYGSSQLLDAEVLLIAQDVCSDPKVYGKFIDNTMFCAGYLDGGVDSCQGDSGGPLTCEKEQVHYAYGIVSWGDSCGQKNKPGVYTRVTHFVDWINAKTAGP
uniref:trypsin n=1 Tax=Electrophorus electricus TaxID=8005 RepID=A0A4W4H7S2_ELEEL